MFIFCRILYVVETLKTYTNKSVAWKRKPDVTTRTKLLCSLGYLHHHAPPITRCRLGHTWRGEDDDGSQRRAITHTHTHTHMISSSGNAKSSLICHYHLRLRYPSSMTDACHSWFDDDCSKTTTFVPSIRRVELVGTSLAPWALWDCWKVVLREQWLGRLDPWVVRVGVRGRRDGCGQAFLLLLPRANSRIVLDD